jgi:hypothetical protein
MSSPKKPPSRQMQALNQAVARVAQKYSDPNLMDLAQELGGSQPMERTAMSEKQSNVVLELRTLARKAFITFREQDAARLRDAADELERLRAALTYVAGLPSADPLTGQLAVTAARAALKCANLIEKS